MAVEIELESELWEENVPMMKEGIHKQLLDKAFALSTPEHPVFPQRNQVFAAMRLTSLRATKVVIIGQDPYFNEHEGKGVEAHGLCFSVKNGIPMPPSLRNILQEVNSSLYGGKPVSTDTNLTRWAKQGVLLINASLTVEKKKPNSHVKLGWHQLTDDVIKTIDQKKNGVVFMLWGAFAQKKAVLIDKERHCILSTSHPSPLSAHRGFLGSNIFVRCNDYLQRTGQSPVKW